MLWPWPWTFVVDQVSHDQTSYQIWQKSNDESPPINTEIREIGVNGLTIGRTAGRHASKRIASIANSWRRQHYCRLRWPVTVMPQVYFSLHVRTSTMSTCARRTRRAHVDMVDVRTSTFTCARRVLRAHVEFKTIWLMAERALFYIIFKLLCSCSTRLL